MLVRLYHVLAVRLVLLAGGLDLVFQLFSPEPAWAAGRLPQHFQALGNPGLKSET
jgi:hypothetical protein